MIYIDSCAIVKLVLVEQETSVLTEWLRQREDQDVVSSALVEVEVPRALLRTAPSLLGRMALVMTKVDRVEINAPVRTTAASYAEAHLRSLDAIHLATAENLVAMGKSVTSFVTYDKRLMAAASDLGFSVASPGTT